MIGFRSSLVFVLALTPELCPGQGTLRVIAGSGSFGFSGDGALAIGAPLGFPTSVAIDAAGNVYFADGLNHRVRRVDTSGIIRTVAGNGSPLFSGDGGAATSAGFFLSTS